MKFKVGDRVRVYGAAVNANDQLAQTWGLKGTIQGIKVAEMGIIVKMDEDTCEYWCHPNQLRRLRKKIKEEPVLIGIAAEPIKEGQFVEWDLATGFISVAKKH